MFPLFQKAESNFKLFNYNIMMKLHKLSIPLLLIFLLTGLSDCQNKNSDKSFFFIQLTDPQFGMFENNKEFTKETELFEKAVIEINRLEPDFVVITGDLVNDPEDELQISEFKRITSKIHSKIPVYLTPGNHDIGMIPDSMNIHRYINNYGYDKFSFVHKGFKFIGFNSSLIKCNTPVFEQRQYDWLSKELIKGKDVTHTILFCHYPFFIKDFNEPENYSNIEMPDREKYLNLFEANKADAVFSGHLHDNAYSKYGGMELITTSPIGMPHGTVSSGMRIIKIKNGSVIEHNFYELGKIPIAITFD